MTAAAKLPRGSWRIAATRAWHGFVRHRGIDAAAALTFFTLLASLPAGLVLVSAFAVLDDRERAVSDLVAVLGSVLPENATVDVEGALRELLSLGRPAVALAVGIALLLWTVSGYATAMGRAINAVYEVEEGRPFWMFRGRMLLLAVVLAAVAAALVATLLGTPEAADDILGRRGLGPLAVGIWAVVRWPLALALAIVFTALLYSYTPNVRHPRIRWASAGSSLAVAIWLVATLGFAGYVALVDHGAIYGSLGGVVIALLWVYLTNLALVAGVELDAEFVRLRRLARGEPAEDRVHLELRDDRRIRLLQAQRAADVAAARRLRETARADGATGSASGSAR